MYTDKVLLRNYIVEESHSKGKFIASKIKNV